MYNNVLKYPGSKWRIADKLVELIPQHHSYIEPFFGSGAVLFRKEISHIETINDIDSNVTNLFFCIKKDPEKVASLVYVTPYSREVYEATYIRDMDFEDEYEKAVAFLIRCWQGHGYRTNGYQVGWKSDVQGRERMYALLNWNRLPGWIIDIAERLRMVQIENRPALDVIRNYDYENVFMYLDPPYVLSTRAAKQYKYEMSDQDHVELLELIKKSKAKIMISGYESELYAQALAGWKRYTFSSHAEMGLARTEVVWLNYEPYQNEQLTLAL